MLQEVRESHFLIEDQFSYAHDHYNRGQRKFEFFLQFPENFDNESKREIILDIKNQIKVFEILKQLSILSHSSEHSMNLPQHVCSLITFMIGTGTFATL